MELVGNVSFAFDPWYVAHCKSRREMYAAHILHSQLGLTVYLPEIETRLRKEVRISPFFSGYFFVQANLQRVGLSRINASPGILKLLDFGDGPLIVPQMLIEMMRERIARYQSHGGFSHQKLSSGDGVRVTSGPLEGLSAIFIDYLTSGERARVLLDFLGRLSKVQVSVDSLEKLSDKASEKGENEPSRRERRTRGKGRRINGTQRIA
jgi:transcriptional antiterminator RfaH